MTFHNQDEIQKFDNSLIALHSLINPKDKEGAVAAVGDIMRELIFHDWPEWAASRRWVLPDDVLEAFDPDDAEFLRRFIVGAVTVLKNDGADGVENLKSYAAKYLQQRGIRVKSAPVQSETYTVSQLANVVDAIDNETARNYLLAAGLQVAKGRGKRMSYTQTEAEKFARQVVAKPSQKNHSIAAERWLRKQK
jgi:hypothetical protein